MAAAPHVIPELDAVGLRHFGLLFGAIIAVLFGLLLPWLFDHGIPRWPFAVGGVFAAWAIAAPTTLRPVYTGWMKFGYFMSRITTPLLMGLIFFIVVTPIGLVRQLVAKDPMKRHFDPNADSYRSRSELPPDDHLENPF